jgi:hypothetical protein
MNCSTIGGIDGISSSRSSTLLNFWIEIGFGSTSSKFALLAWQRCSCSLMQVVATMSGY